MGEDQLALRTNERWLPEEKGPTTNEKGPTTNADFGWVIPVNIYHKHMNNGAPGDSNKREPEMD